MNSTKYLLASEKQGVKKTFSKHMLLLTSLVFSCQNILKMNITKKTKTQSSTWIWIFIRMVLNRESPIILLYFRIQSTRLQSKNSIRVENLNLIKITKNINTLIKSHIQNLNSLKPETKIKQQKIVISKQSPHGSYS